MACIAQTADAAYVAEAEGRPKVGSFTGADKASASRRHLVSADLPSPATWTQETAFFRTAVFGGPEPYVANDIGGATRKLRLYGQDAIAPKRRAGTDTVGEHSCTKWQYPNKKLSPGLMVRLPLYISTLLHPLRERHST
jgi:hypothetical protein